MNDKNDGKIDRRIRRTRAALKHVLMELLKKKPIDKITVTELCQMVEINRSTFYQHYCDVYALLEDIESDFLIQCDVLAQEIINSTLPPLEVSNRLLRYIYENKELLYLFVFRHKQEDFELRIHEKILRLFRIKVLQTYTLQPNVTSTEFDDLLLFLTAGYYSVYKRWIKDGCKDDIDAIASQITIISDLCLNHFLQAK